MFSAFSAVIDLDEFFSMLTGVYIAKGDEIGDEIINQLYKTSKCLKYVTSYKHDVKVANNQKWDFLV